MEIQAIQGCISRYIHPAFNYGKKLLIQLQRSTPVKQ